MRLPSACFQCRRAKRSCCRTALHDACDRCRLKGLTCGGHLVSRQRSHGDQTLLLPRSLNADQKLELPSGVAIELVELYLGRVNNGRPHSLFHPETLRSKLHSGSLSRPLLDAICAIGAKFSTNPDVRSLGPRFLSDAKRLVQLDMENVCLEHLQTCILIATLCIDTSNASEALFHRIATTMADILQLNSKSRSDMPLIMAEERRRAWWSLYLSDNWCVLGLGVLTPLRHTEILLDLPMDEDLNRRVAECATSTTSFDDEVKSLAEKLEVWKISLVSTHHMSLDNLHHHQERGSGGCFVLLHLTYHYFSTLLYFRFLEEHEEKTIPAYFEYITRCKSHASSFSTLLRRARQLKGCEPIFPLMGYMTTVSSTVLIHTLLFGDIANLAGAREELQANFEALMELQNYWTGTSTMDICLLSSDAKPHRLDGWMLKFLLERSLDHQQASTHNVMDSASVASRAKVLEGAGRYTQFTVT